MKLLCPLVLAFATAACASTPPPSTPVPPRKEAKERPSYPASREPLFVEFVTIPTRWVAKYMPDGAADAKAWTAEASKKLGAEMTKRLRSSHDVREAIADSVQAVLGDSAVADPDRPKMNVVDREQIKDLKHLSAAAKAGLGQFADHARPTDILDSPVADGEVVIVAHAVAAGG